MYVMARWEPACRVTGFEVSKVESAIEEQPEAGAERSPAASMLRVAPLSDQEAQRLRQTQQAACRPVHCLRALE